MSRRARLDVELVRRGLATSRTEAVALVDAGRVQVGGVRAAKSATAVDRDTPLLVKADENDPGYASRGAHKLAGAIAAFAPGGLRIAGRRCLDAGASTGGFTDVLLREGAAAVVAVDVGYGQLIWRLRTDPRVIVLDRVNARDLNADAVDPPVGVVVADLSFISLGLVIPALRRVAEADADFVVMVKPQFEVGRGRVGSGGVVRDPDLRAEAVSGVAAAGAAAGLGMAGVVASPLPGPSGNVEYFLWLREDAPAPDSVTARAAVRAAVEAGPR